MIGYFIERVAFMVGFAVAYRLLKKATEPAVAVPVQQGRHLRLVSLNRGLLYGRDDTTE